VVEDAVQVGLVDDLAREDRIPATRTHLHLFEGQGEALTDLVAHHDAVDLPGSLAGPLLWASVQYSLSLRHARTHCPHPSACFT
jgi:hypothetical protein